MTLEKYNNPKEREAKAFIIQNIKSLKKKMVDTSNSPGAGKVKINKATKITRVI